MAAQGTWYWADSNRDVNDNRYMGMNIIQKLAGVVALTGGLPGIGAALAKRLAPNGADVAELIFACADVCAYKS
jgi:hypothetical protein